ncbi:MAG: hypothetical protein IPM08_09635 [Actinomycetales bacterium]|nr:hypothetical protein [Actinomycetales bacterium]
MTTIPSFTASPLTIQLLATATGALLLTAVLLLWRRSITGAAGLLGVQGLALAALSWAAATEGEPHLYALAALLALIKGFVIPALVLRTARRLDAATEGSPVVNPATGMLLAAALTTVAFLVGTPVATATARSTGAAVPVGLAVVLIGFLVLATRREALGQIIAFVVVDNGIGATAVLAAGGLPAVIEVGVLFDVLLVVLVLLILTRRIRRGLAFTDVSRLNELRD